MHLQLIILVQVRYDIKYNKGIKDSGQVYSLAIKDWYEEGKYATFVNRSNSEEIIHGLPLVEKEGLLEPFGSPTPDLFN